MIKQDTQLLLWPLYTCAWVHIPKHTCAYIYAHMPTYIHIHMHMTTHLYTHIYIYAYALPTHTPIFLKLLQHKHYYTKIV